MCVAAIFWDLLALTGNARPAFGVLTKTAAYDVHSMYH